MGTCLDEGAKSCQENKMNGIAFRHPSSNRLHLFEFRDDKLFPIAQEDGKEREITGMETLQMIADLFEKQDIGKEAQKELKKLRARADIVAERLWRLLTK